MSERFNNLPVACVVLDRRAAVLEVNAAAQALLKRKPEVLSGLPFASLVVASRQSEFLQHLWEAFRQPDRVVTLETRIRRHDFEVPVELSSRATGELCQTVLMEVPPRVFLEQTWRGGLSARDLFDRIPVPALLIGSRGTIQAANPPAGRLLGCAPEDLEDRRLITVLNLPPATSDDGPRLATARHSDGRTLSVEVVSSGNKGPASILLLRDRSVGQSGELLLRRLADEQRRQIGQDLHDTVGQNLTGMSLLAQALAEELEGNSRAQRLAELTMQTTGEIRRLIRGACGATPEEPDLSYRLHRLAQANSELYGVQCLARCSQLELDQDTLEQLEHIAREAVTNAVKHGKAGRVLIRWGRVGGELRLSVSDDGIGLQPGRKTGGLGIRGMRQRAAAVGGRLVVKENSKGGTLVECRLPHHFGSKVSR